ncbi:MAG: 4-hydroxy-tetrahydrodipicolinate synthase [Fusobacteriaceae bacterium]|jgi:4-hydroxy-tetrahydrodipicolinate synthase|nr:4-hydroxy-tetrahydrodipicolinate synthase [Fusobacteriaceae bacterium]
MAVFTGSGVALATPFDEKNRINYDVYGQLIDFHLRNKTDAFIINGTTGESPTLSDEEKTEALRFTMERVGGKVPVIAGSGTNDTGHAVKISKEAEKCGVDALLVVTPYYNKGNESGIYNYYKTIAEAVSIPIIIYTVPGRTGVNLSVPLLKKLSGVKNIIGVKDATGNLSYTAQIASEIPAFDIYSGNDDVVLPVMSLGGKGVISVSANIIPLETHEMAAAAYNNNFAKAREIQLKYLPLINALFYEVNPVPVKEALNLLGVNVGPGRSPLGPIEEKNRVILKELIEKLGVRI